MIDFGIALREARRAKKLSQGELGEMVGVSNNAICSYETDRSEPSLVVLCKLCVVLEVSADELLGLASE